MSELATHRRCRHAVAVTAATAAILVPTCVTEQVGVGGFVVVVFVVVVVVVVVFVAGGGGAVWCLLCVARCLFGVVCCLLCVVFV